MSELLLAHQPCKCGSSDAKSYYIEGGSHCFKCGVTKKHDTPNGDGGAIVQKPVQHKKTVEDIKGLEFGDLSGRGITQPVMDMFQVRQDESTWYFPYTKDGEVVGFKCRSKNGKKFYSIGSLGKDVDPFGWSRVSEGGKMLIITEGEVDALSATQMLKEKGKNYKVVSIPNGAQGAVDFLKSNMGKLVGFEKIILNFDSDDVGREAQKESLKVLAMGQAFGMVLPSEYKDANDLLTKGKAYQYLDAIYTAKQYKPDGIVSGVDTWDLYNERPEVTSYPFPESWDMLNQKTYGIRLGELDTFTSGTSAGKTQFVREIAYHFVTTTDLKVGLLSLEEPLTDTIESYVELALNKRISLPDVESTEAERREGWEKTLGSGKMDLYDAFGGEEDSVVNQIRYMAKGCDCKLIFVDHLHMLLDGKDGNTAQVERIMLRLKKLTQELGVWIGLVAHLRKSSGVSFEEGGIAKLDDLKDSSTIKQLSNGVYILGRDQQADDVLTQNTTQIVVGKCRFTGRTGYADRLYFDDDTGRMNKLNNDDVPY